MKIKPVVMEKLRTRHTSFVVDFVLDYNITFINGDSGTGKSAVFSFIEEIGAEDKRIRCFNYLDLKQGYKNSIKRLKNKLIVIDNADVLLDDSMRQFIAEDMRNQYIIIGRNPSGLMLVYENVYELEHEDNEGLIVFTLKSIA